MTDDSWAAFKPQKGPPAAETDTWSAFSPQAPSVRNSPQTSDRADTWSAFNPQAAPKAPTSDSWSAFNPQAAPASGERGVLGEIGHALDIRPQIEHTLETGKKAGSAALNFLPEAIGGVAGAPAGPAGVAAGVAGGHIAKEALGSLLPTALEEGATALGVNPTTPAGHKLVERGALSSAIGKASMAVRPGGAGVPSAEAPATTIPEGPTPQPEAPAKPSGTVRFYHGGFNDPATGGGRWAATDSEYARNYNAGETGPKTVWYVDIPKGDPAEIAARHWDEIDERGGTNSVGRYGNTELPEHWAKKMKRLDQPVTSRDELANLPLDPSAGGGPPADWTSETNPARANQLQIEGHYERASNYANDRTPGPAATVTPQMERALTSLHTDKTMRQVGNVMNTLQAVPHNTPFEGVRYIIGPDGRIHFADARSWTHDAMANEGGYAGADKAGIRGGLLTPEQYATARAKYKTTEEFNDYLKATSLPGNMNLGRGDLGAAGVPKPPNRPVSIEDVNQVDWDRYEMAGRHHANFVEAINELGKRPREMIVAEPILSQLAEGDPNTIATPYEERLAAEVLPKYKEKSYDLWKARTEAYAKGDYPEEVIDALRQQNNPNYFPRKSERFVKEMAGLAGQLEADPASSTGGAGYQGHGRGTYEAGSEHARSYFALENANGERKLVHLNRTNLEEVNGSKTYSLGDEPPLPNTTTLKDSAGGEWLLRDAYIREIEAATPERYIKDASLAYKINEIELERSIDEASYAATKKAEMIEQGWATTSGAVGRKNGWVIPRNFPGLSRTYVEPRLARALDRYPAFKPGDDVMEWLVGANHWLTRSLFAYPLPHIENTLEMYAMDFKLSSPSTFVEAIREVREGHPDFLRAVRTGMPSWTSADAVRKFWKGGEAEIRELEKMPQTANIAMRLGMKPVELIRGIYDYSHAAMSNVQDVLMWSRTKDYLRKGFPMKAAIQEALKSMPSYRTATEQNIGQDMMKGMSGTAAKISNLPAKIQDSQLGKFAFNFTRYYGNTAANSIGRPVRMLLEAYKGVKLRGSDPAASKAAFATAKRDFFRTAANLFAYTVIMPYIADKAVQAMTGDQRSRATRWGTLGVWQAIDDVVHHRPLSDVTRLLAFAPSPALGMAWDVAGYGMGKVMNYGKTAQQAGSRHETMAQLGMKLLERLPPYELYGKMLPKSGVNKKPDTWGETAAKLTLGEHKEPRPDTPFVKPPPGMRLR